MGYPNLDFVLSPWLCVLVLWTSGGGVVVDLDLILVNDEEEEEEPYLKMSVNFLHLLISS
jgi:hypothetical protein